MIERTTTVSDERQADALIVRDSTGAFYEIPWNAVTGYRVPGERSGELQALLDADTGGFQLPDPQFRPPTTRLINLPTSNIIAILIG